MYRAAVREGSDIEWRCILCEHPNAESTIESLPDAESTRFEETSQAEPDPSVPDAESTRIEPIAASSTSHESLHPPIEISWGCQLEQFVREQLEGSTDGKSHFISYTCVAGKSRQKIERNLK